MAREPVVTSSTAPDSWDDPLRPKRLDQVVGQRELIQRLEIAINAAKKRREPLGHMLFSGPPGLGKTTLATVLAKEMATRSTILSGPTLAAPKDLLAALTNATEGSVLFIDEIHPLDRLKQADRLVDVAPFCGQSCQQPAPLRHVFVSLNPLPHDLLKLPRFVERDEQAVLHVLPRRGTVSTRLDAGIDVGHQPLPHFRRRPSH